MLRPGVWNLSKQSAGESIVFVTDSKEITVRYTVTLRHGMEQYSSAPSGYPGSESRLFRMCLSSLPIISVIRRVRPHRVIVRRKTVPGMFGRLFINSLLAEGMKNLYHIPHTDIAMPQDATVDGSHPTDYGMVVYADVYEKMIRKVLGKRYFKLLTP